MSDDIEMVDYKIDIEVGDGYFRYKSVVPKLSETVYLAGTSAGTVAGMKASSDFLIDLIPDDAPLGAKIQEAASKAAKQSLG